MPIRTRIRPPATDTITISVRVSIFNHRNFYWKATPVAFFLQFHRPFIFIRYLEEAVQDVCSYVSYEGRHHCYLPKGQGAKREIKIEYSKSGYYPNEACDSQDDGHVPFGRLPVFQEPCQRPEEASQEAPEGEKLKHDNILAERLKKQGFKPSRP
jgi:hypothetical protein